MSTWEQRQAARLAYERDVENARKDSTIHAPRLGASSSNAQREENSFRSHTKLGGTAEHSTPVKEHGVVNALDARLAAKHNYEEKLRLALSPARPAPVEAAGIPLAVVAASPTLSPDQVPGRGLTDLNSRQPDDEFLMRNTSSEPQQPSGEQNFAAVSLEKERDHNRTTPRNQAGGTVGNVQNQNSGRLRKEDVSEHRAVIRPQYSSSTLTQWNTADNLTQKPDRNPQQQLLQQLEQQKENAIARVTPHREANLRQEKEDLSIQLFADEDRTRMIDEEQHRQQAMPQRSEQQQDNAGRMQEPSQDQQTRQLFAEEQAQFEETQVDGAHKVLKSASESFGIQRNGRFQGNPAVVNEMLLPPRNLLGHSSRSAGFLLPTAGRESSQQPATEVQQPFAPYEKKGNAFDATTMDLKNEIEGLKREVFLLRTQKTASERPSSSLRFSSQQPHPQPPQAADSRQSATISALLLRECTDEGWHISSIQSLDQPHSSALNPHVENCNHISLGSGEGSRPKSATLLSEARGMLQIALSESSALGESKPALPAIPRNATPYARVRESQENFATTRQEKDLREVDELISASKFVPYYY